MVSVTGETLYALDLEKGFNACDDGFYSVVLPNNVSKCVNETVLLQGITDGDVMVDATRQSQGVPTKDQFYKYYNVFIDECKTVDNPCYVKAGRYRKVRDSNGNESVRNVHPKNIITTNEVRLADPKRRQRLMAVMKGEKPASQSTCNDYIGDLLFGSMTEGGYCIECNKNSASNKANPFSVMDEIGPGRIPLSCFKAAMKDHKVLYSKKTCNGDNEAQSVTDEPCITDASVKRISEVFHGGSRCSQMNPDQLFPLFNHESRFVPNAQSGTGASCFGQMIGIAVKEVNRVYGQDEIEKMGRSCDVYKGLAGSADPDKKCDILASPETCMLYSILFQKLLRQKAEKKVIEYSAKLKNPKKIVDYLSWWGHNGGDSAIQTYFVSYMDSVKEPLSDKAFLEGFAEYLGKNYPGDAKRKEQVKSFVADVISDKDKIGEQAGKRCEAGASTVGES